MAGPGVAVKWKNLEPMASQPALGPF